jgi:hypothetical protein
MNSTPVILHNISGTRVMADVRVPKGTRAISIIPVDPEILSNCALLNPSDHAALSYDPEASLLAQEEQEASPFSVIRNWLDDWKIEHDDCPGLATLLDTIDHAGIGRSFDLKFWLQAWQRA